MKIWVKSLIVATKWYLLLFLESESTNSKQQQIARSPSLDWTQYYLKSERHFNFRLKSVHLPSFSYDCYIFQADLTDLNCDALVNASNSSLHPGYYSGDGVSGRIREKGGKQMQDSLKKILAQVAYWFHFIYFLPIHGLVSQIIHRLTR